MRVVVLRFPYPGCDFEVGGDMDRGKVAEQKADTCLPGNGQKQSLMLASIVQEKRGMPSFPNILSGKT